FRKLSAVLNAAGKTFEDVARAGVYLTRMTDFVAMNGIYAKHFSQPFPARTTIAAAALPLGACVEIDLIVKACKVKVMKLLLIGASGTIGQAIATALSQRHELIGVSRHSAPAHVDISSRASIRALFAEV